MFYSMTHEFWGIVFLFLCIESLYFLLFISTIVALKPNNVVNIKVMLLKGSLGYRNILNYLNNSHNFLPSFVFFTEDFYKI